MLAEEFFTSYRFTSTTDLDKPTISFRLLGLEFEMNMSEWAVRLGVATVSEVEMSHWRRMERGVPGNHITFDGGKEWKKVAREGAAEFSANKSLGADIKDHVLRLAQIYLGFNLLGQSTCVTRVSLTELYFMRKMQKGENVNLAFWLAYQAHQINRSKTRHLNLCHIVGIFLRNNLDLVHARKGLQVEMCMAPRPFNLDFLIEHQIVRVLKGDHVFYELGHVTPKTRKRPNLVQVRGGENKAKAGDKYSLEWLVDEVHAQRSQIDKIHTMVEEIWGALKRVRARQAEAEENSKQEEAETEAMEKIKKKKMGMRRVMLAIMMKKSRQPY